MATESQIRANRMNAQKSTGPRSKEGKEAVSQNATKHGLCSCKNVIKTESPEQYNLFHDDMIEDLAPAGAMELMLAERIANLSWRLKRAEVFQNAVIESLTDDVNDLSYKSYIRAREQADEGDLSLVLGIAIRRDFEGSRILENLLIYEKRIESSLYKATAELRKLQKVRREQETIDEGRCRMDEGRENAIPPLGKAATQCKMVDEGREEMGEGRETNDDLNKSGFVPRKLLRDKHPTSSFGLRRTRTQSEIGERKIAEQSQSTVAEAMEDKLSGKVVQCLK